MWQKIVGFLMTSTVVKMLVDRVIIAAIEWLKGYTDKKKAEKVLKQAFKEQMKEIVNDPDAKNRADRMDKFING